MSDALQTVSIFSLTAPGQQLADKLLALLPQAVHHHKPAAFIDTAQTAFTEQNRCIFICSTGIVMRALAPVLVDKHHDPAVLALDQAGRFVVVLLAGHEGGGCEFGRVVARHLGAQLVITSATDYSQPVYSIGLGSDRGCPLEMLESLYRQALDELRQPVEFAAVASIDLKRNEAGMIALADRLALPLQCYSAGVLRRVEEQLSVKSALVFAQTGCYGVAESAALVAASEVTGRPAELVVRKRKNARATLSIARSYR